MKNYVLENQKTLFSEQKEACKGVNIKAYFGISEELFSVVRKLIEDYISTPGLLTHQQIVSFVMKDLY